MGSEGKYDPDFRIVCDAESLALSCLEIFICDAQKSIADRGVFYVAISGGNTPRLFFELLGDSKQSMALDWRKIHIFWVDERYVRLDSQWSNYKLAADTFLPKVGIPAENVHRIETEDSDNQAAAHHYEQTIRRVFGLGQAEMPVFDLIILGMGADGHTGSLFPDSYAAFDTNDLACVVYVMDDKMNRITLTYPVLRAASHIVVLVSGEEKASILNEVMTTEPDEVKYPIHVLWPVLDKVTWLVDIESARLLPKGC